MGYLEELENKTLDDLEKRLHDRVINGAVDKQLINWLIDRNFDIDYHYEAKDIGFRFYDSEVDLIIEIEDHVWRNKELKIKNWLHQLVEYYDVDADEAVTHQL